MDNYSRPMPCLGILGTLDGSTHDVQSFPTVRQACRVLGERCNSTWVRRELALYHYVRLNPAKHNGYEFAEIRIPVPPD